MLLYKKAASSERQPFLLKRKVFVYIFCRSSRDVALPFFTLKKGSKKSRHFGYLPAEGRFERNG